jgi:hypothetical protein
MLSQSSSYRLKRFSSSRDPDFAAALLLYVRNTPITIRTDSDEIAYWIDEFSHKFNGTFHVFGFYRDKILVGYAQAAYLTEERIIALDYISIDEIYRRNNIFYEFVDHLKVFLENAHPEYRYAVTESCYRPDDLQPARESILFTRLLKLQGFRVIHAPYYQPQLSDENPESEVKADLLIYSMPHVDMLRVETFLSIVKTLYYKYYLPWKNIRSNTSTKYKNHLDALYSKIESDVRRQSLITVNGHQDILSAPSQQPNTFLHDTVNFALQALCVVILLTAAMLTLRSIFNLSDTFFALVYVLAIASFVAVAGIVSKDARRVFGQMSSIAKYAFDRQKNGLMKTSVEKEHVERRNQDEQQ